MGKTLLLIILVAVSKCNGQFPGIGDLVPATQKQLQGALGLASSILGGISSGIGLNFDGLLGSNTQARPENNNNHKYPNKPQTNLEMTGVENESKYGPSIPTHYGYNSYQQHSPPHHGRPGGYGSGHWNHGYEYPNHYGNDNYNNNYNNNGPSHPGHHNYHQGENFNNNGNHGTAYPNNQNLANVKPYNHNNFNNRKPYNEYPGNYYNQAYDNNNQFYQNSHSSPPQHNPVNDNKPIYGNTNNYNENNQEYLNNINQIFGNNPSHPHNEVNSGTQKPNVGGTEHQNPLGNSNNKPLEITSKPISLTDKVNEDPKEDLPIFVPLAPSDTKTETDTKKPTSEDEEFNIDIRFKDQ